MQGCEALYQWIFLEDTLAPYRRGSGYIVGTRLLKNLL